LGGCDFGIEDDRPAVDDLVEVLVDALAVQGDEHVDGLDVARYRLGLTLRV